MNNNKPFFSVILPVYNVEAQLHRCLDSVLAQTFHNYEVILVDDGSTDSSGKICDLYTENYSFIRVIHKNNGGLSSARNAGFMDAKGKYILWFDSDDWIEKETLQIIYDAVSNKEPDLIKFNYIRHEGSPVKCSTVAPAGEYVGSDEIEPLIRMAFTRTGAFGLSACMNAYRTEFLREHNFSFISEREVGSEDFLFNLQVMLNVESVTILEDYLYHYDCRGGSLTQRYRDKLPEQYTKLYVTLKEYLKQEKLLESYQNLLHYLYVWALIYKCCMVNEYHVTEKHTLEEGRKKVKRFLRFPELQDSIKRLDRSFFTTKEWIQISAMKHGMEWMFYWLFYKKRCTK